MEYIISGKEKQDCKSRMIYIESEERKQKAEEKEFQR